jgi:transposase
LERLRLAAARLSDQGIEPSIIAAGLQVDDQTVRRWLRLYRGGGEEALKAKLHPGPDPRLTEEQKQQLLEYIQCPPSEYGLGGHLWTAGRMAELIRQRFQVRYHPGHIGQMMHDLDYTQQLPQKRARERNEEKIEQWRTQHWPQIVQRARQSHARIAFVDESGFLMNPLRKKVWAPKGQTPELRHRTRHHEKVSVIGALVAGSGPQEVELLTQWHPGANVNQSRVVEFLEKLLAEQPGAMIVVWDNLAAHRGQAVKDFLREHPQLWLEALPGYAPDLNPIEQVWCMSKYHRLANHTIADVEALHQAAQRATDEVARQKDLLLSCIRHAGLANALYPPEDQ